MARNLWRFRYFDAFSANVGDKRRASPTRTKSRRKDLERVRVMGGRVRRSGARGVASDEITIPDASQSLPATGGQD